LAAIGLGVAAFATVAAARADCVETGPSGVERAQLVDSFPTRGTSGYAATLHVVVTHGKGETVLPRGLELQTGSDTAKMLKEAGFALPDQTGEAQARLATADVDPKTGRRQTVVDLPLVALPANPGRHTLVLPALPISIARASSDVITVCTKPHSIVVEDPTASTPGAVPQPNPVARAQREEWTSLKRALEWGAAGVVAGGILAWLVYRWVKRPKPAVPPPPPRPPWEIALQRLDEVRHAGLLETKRFAEFFDRVNDAVRQCLGARYGFDGLESTTDETIEALRRVSQLRVPLPEVVAFLQECDLVKFADVTPSTEACTQALVDAERVVRATIPAVSPVMEGARP
jgi:hypothetical protein